MGSLTKGACSTVTLRSEEYTVRDEFSGVLLLKVIFSESLVETKSTINNLISKINAGINAVAKTEIYFRDQHQRSISEIDTEIDLDINL